ncbi:MAG: chitobiase/beta-hexosaminidase C-terminal domain-containing protein, partial [Proteiniphilum sp.]|nr:chitobiase/beta-hexosaminidase C-terminal domain-containing protein [Proteiniphilum sp.]
PISITSTTTLKAKAFKSGWNESAIANSSYSIEMPQTVATPTFSPSGGTYTSAQSVTISCSTPGATIRYTTNGSEPTSSSTIYSRPINVSSTTTIKAKAFKDGWTPSSTASATYTIAPIGTVATPTFIPAGGTYSTAQNVNITTTTANATIRYTTNGSNPTESSAQYTGPINISTTSTLKARAYRSGWTPSYIANTTYTITGTVVTPTFNPGGGTYTSAQNVTISCATSGASIFYSTNGSTPSIPYNGPINIGSTTTLKAKATKTGWNDSSIASAIYTINIQPSTVATPTFNPGGGTYTSAQNVTISCATSGASIFYSTNGSTPSIPYNGPINIGSTTTLKAKATKTGWNDSSIASAIYTINIQPSTVATPTFNPGGGTYSSAQNVALSCTTTGATIRYTTNGSEPTSSSTAYSSPINVSSTTTIKAKGFKDGWTPSSTAIATYTIETTPPPANFVFVPGGTFTMGDTRGEGFDDELPTHVVALNSFYIGKYEITQAEYSQYMQPSSSWTSNYGHGDDYPAYYVSWYAILKYCNLRSMAEGLTPVYTISGSTNPANWGSVPTSSNSTWNAATCNWNANGYRLPTEAEWEYAARGATNTPDYLYSGSDDINTVAWYDGNNSPSGSKPVGTKAPNGLGLYDMSGNLSEWCWDWYSFVYYSSYPYSNPTGPASGSERVSRGGNWIGTSGYCRVASRLLSIHPSGSYADIGFRLCRAN